MVQYQHSFVTEPIVINNKPYSIKKAMWEKHLAMHPVRPVDALASSLYVMYGERQYDVHEIEKLINDEYNMSIEFGNTVIRAEELYAKRKHATC